MLRVGALILIAALSSPHSIQQAPSQQVPTNPSPTHSEQPHPDNRGTEASPFAVKLMNTGQTDAQAAENKKREDAKAAFERQIATENIRLTWGLVLVGIIQACAIGYTAIVSNRAARSAQDSAKAALAQLRAFVGIKSVTLEGAALGEIPRATIFLQNTGQTPALNYTQVGVMGIDFYPAPKSLPQIGDIDLRESQPLGAGSEIQMHVPFTKALQAHHIVALQNRTMAIYVVGAISYLDVFDRRQTHQFKLFSNAEGGWHLGQMAAFIGDPRLNS